MNRKSFIGLVSVVALMGINAQAQEQQNGNWYAGVDGFVSFLGNERATRSNLNVLNDYKTGGGFAGIFGYDFGTLRLETEIGKHYNSLERIGVSTDTTLGLTSGSASGGKFDNTHYMFNAVFDLDSMFDGLALNPFIGGGLGVSTLKLNGHAASGNPVYVVNSSDDLITYQAFVGLRTPLSDNVDVSLKYRFMGTNDADLIDRLGQGFSYTNDIHDIVLGITYKFGAKKNTRMAKRPAPIPAPEPVSRTEPDPTPVAAIAPAAPPPAPVIEKGPYAIYFEWDSSFISSDAREVIRKAMQESAKADQITIQVDGHADRSGPNGYNDNLSFERAKAVREFIVANGIEENKVIIEGHGERTPEVDTADGVREQRNRRVTIKLN